LGQYSGEEYWSTKKVRAKHPHTMPSLGKDTNMTYQRIDSQLNINTGLAIM
jgi:hypothetical protein